MKEKKNDLYDVIKGKLKLKAQIRIALRQLFQIGKMIKTDEEKSATVAAPAPTMADKPKQPARDETEGDVSPIFKIKPCSGLLEKIIGGFVQFFDIL